MTLIGAAGGLVHRDITREVIGAFFEVYDELGHGFIESVYQRAMPIALSARGVQSEREVPLRVHFRGYPVGDYRADLVVAQRVIVEIKAADRLLPVHEIQLLNYLRATGLQVGLLLNFGPRRSFRRLILSAPRAISAQLRAPSA